VLFEFDNESVCFGRLKSLPMNPINPICRFTLFGYRGQSGGNPEGPPDGIPP
jgi:hypothetical protein